MEELIIYISFQSYVSVKERQLSQRIQKQNVSQRSFCSSGASTTGDSGSQSHDVMLGVVLLSSFYPLSENKISQALPVSLWWLAEPAVQSILIELVLKQLMELQLLSLNGQFYCILMENVIIGWTRLTENTFLSLYFCSHLQPIVNRV